MYGGAVVAAEVVRVAAAIVADRRGWQRGRGGRREGKGGWIDSWVERGVGGGDRVGKGESI